ncbi:hypothetical protein [Helicobacter labacensis]|uniref:hypothetical protein n=1 Tax=Helicobacter labacensis TaxID=2316079 RepID=UPI000EB3F480|nr:hypothetical protein [Helicobacter labacensis]
MCDGGVQLIPQQRFTDKLAHDTEQGLRAIEHQEIAHDLYMQVKLVTQENKELRVQMKTASTKKTTSQKHKND